LKAFKRKSLEELTSEEVVRACEENYINFWRNIGTSPNAEFSGDKGITRCITGLSQDVFNVVLKCNLDPETIDTRIDDAIKYFRFRRIPLLWHTGILSEPKDIGKYLEARGFPMDYELAAMAVDLSAIGESFELSEIVSVHTVTYEADSKRWAECLVSSWESPKETVSWMKHNVCFNPSLEKSNITSPPRRMYMALLEGKPVSTSMLVWDNEVAGLEMVGTIPSARGKGAGTAVVQAALADAHAMGFRFVVVLGTIEGVRLYEKCGFKTFGKLPEHTMDFRDLAH